jgi:hypothetical protein
VAAPAEHAGAPIAGTYKQTHGRQIASIAAPYVEEYATRNDVDLERLTRSLYPDGLAPRSAASGLWISLSSYSHSDGDWTFVRSNRIGIYEMSKLRIGDAEPFLLVLRALHPPADMVIDTFDADWYVTLVGPDYQIRAEQVVATHIPHPATGLWDMIYTNLTLQDGHPVVTIAYAHTGGGGGRNQEFRFDLAVNREPFCLGLVKGEQTQDEYLEAE